MDKQPEFHVGGSIESALKGQYTINVLAVLKEAWLHTTHTRKSINLSLLFIMSIGVFITLMLVEYFGGLVEVQKSDQASFIINMVISIVLSPFIAGVEMIGIFNSVGIKTQPKLMFTFLKYASYVSLCSIFTALLVTIGFQLLILPGIYLLIALTLTMPLIIEKKLSPMKAIIISLQATRFQWFQIFALHIILLVIVIIVSLPLAMIMNGNAGIIGVVLFFFSMSYIAPMYYHVKGILFREIFGIDLKVVDQKNSQQNTFSA